MSTFDPNVEIASLQNDLAALRAELGEARQRLREYEGCPHCGCDHPPETMCAPHECRPGLTMTDRLVAGNIKYRAELDAARQHQKKAEDRLVEMKAEYDGQTQAKLDLQEALDAARQRIAELEARVAPLDAGPVCLLSEYQAIRQRVAEATAFSSFRRVCRKFFRYAEATSADDWDQDESCEIMNDAERELADAIERGINLYLEERK